MPEVRINGTKIHYRYDGSSTGATIMFSNSIAADLEIFAPQIPTLIRSGFRVLRYDGRGQGDSGIEGAPYNIEMLAQDAVSLMDALNLEKVHFCGFSMGGMIAQKLGARYTNRLLSLILANTAPCLGSKTWWNDRITTLTQKGVGVVVDDIIAVRFTQLSRVRLKQAVALDRARILATPIEGFCGCCAAIRDADLREEIREIQVPTLILAAEHDVGASIEMARMMHDRITNSSLVVIPDAAHFSNIEQPELFNAALLHFLEKLR